ncbi:MAG: pre-peptidase C-terminal domain-containing protein [Thermoanaerobaculales bacterium]|jgi:V8-like Glu-specific endopeptidase|nr:pre-peptidase C-terminal domain-containing protein [Thermoanaerobaculales bacterium]
MARETATRRIDRYLLTSVVIGMVCMPAATVAEEPEREDPAVVHHSLIDVKRPSALTAPEEIRNWPSLEPPGARGAPRNLATQPLQTVVFDLISRQETLLDYEPFTGPATEQKTEGFPGIEPSGIPAESVIGADDRQLITSVTTFPWNTVVKLYIEAPDGTNWICSGEMIDSFHVMTAGHCIYLHDHGGWATSVRFVPGMDQDYWPYNYAWGTFIRSYTGWTSDENHHHDWAVVTIDRNVGSFTGWMGRWTEDPSHSWYTSIANVAGYPSDLDGGARMYFDADYGRTADDYNHWYYMDTAGGMSGGPVWIYSGGNRYIVTIHAYGDDGSGSNHGTRLNQEKYDRIFYWLDADTPPTDRPDLVDDGQAWSGFSPSTVTRDITSFSAWNDARNVGTASSGSFHVYFYASTDTIISESDYFIGSTFVPSIDPFNYGDVSWGGTFPQSIPSGSYYIGWMLDGPGVISEFDESNNTAYDDTMITVLDPCALDVYEPDNTSGTASAFTLSTIQTHSLCLEGDTDWVTFYLNVDSNVTISTNGPSGDTVMQLFDASLTPIAFDDDGGPGLFSLIIDSIDAGTYYVQIWEYGSNDYITTYDLEIDAAPSLQIFSDGFESGHTGAWGP